MAENRNKEETSKPSNHSGRKQKQSYKQKKNTNAKLICFNQRQVKSKSTTFWFISTQNRDRKQPHNSK